MANTAVETSETSAALHRAASGPERLMQFLRDTREEMHKVVVPTREQVQSNTIIVIATVFLFAAYFEFVDLTVGKLMDKIFMLITHH